MSMVWASSRWRIVALVAFVNLFVFALIAMSLEGSFQQYRDRAAVTSRNTNRLVSQGIANDIDRLDLALMAVVDEYSRQSQGYVPGWSAMRPFLARLQSRLPMADALRIAQADGELVVGSDIVRPGISIADRGHFKKLRDDPKAGLIISEPILGRVNGRWELVFGRRLVSPQGEFAGAVFATIIIEWFTQRFNSLEVGAHGAVVLRGDASRNFDLLARFPAAGFVGQTKVSETFQAAIAANPHGGTYQARAGADDILRTFSYAAVGDYPLITLVGFATEDYLGEWWRELFKLTALGAVFVLATIAGGVAMFRTWRTLEQQTEELARSNADLEQFAYVASHDLQTPLRNIASFTQLLERRYRGQLDADADEFINYIVGGAKHLSRMISDLLDYARIRAADQKSMPVDLGSVVATVLAELRPELVAAEANVTVGELPVVDAEPIQMERLFRNLIDNAIRYRDSERSLQISIDARSEGGGIWRLAVRDNGVGVAPEYQARIFVIFQRLEPAKSPSGTGIGLAICRRIIFRFGGRIWIESEEGKGSSILFTLPAATPGADSPLAIIARQGPPSEEEHVRAVLSG